MKFKVLFFVLTTFFLMNIAVADEDRSRPREGQRSELFGGLNGGTSGGTTGGTTGGTSGGASGGTTGGTSGGTSGGTGTTSGGTTGGGGDLGCTRTQGFWGNSPQGEALATQLINNNGGLMLGNKVYTSAEIASILDEPVGGNALVSLAHQEIAAKLNVLNGADDSQVAGDFTTADGLIGNLVVPPVGSDVVAPNSMLGQQMLQVKDHLDAYNNGNLNVPKCD